MLIDIDRIKVEKRIRKDYGDIEGLALSIKELGLLNPPVVTPDFTLIAGERRLKALQYLGYKQITVNTMVFEDYEQKLKAEVHENEQRKEFSFSERLEWARELEQVERLKAKERQLSGLNNQDVVEQDLGQRGKTDRVVADQTGFGNKETYRQAKYIADNAKEEVVQQLDNEEISIHAAYTKVKKEKEDLENTNRNLENTIQSLKDQPPRFKEVIKEIVPDHVRKELEDTKTDLQNETRDKRLLQIMISNLEDEKRKLQDIADESNNEFLNTCKKEELLKSKSHVSMFELQIQIQDFVTKSAPALYLQGAMAYADNYVKRELIESAKALERYVDNLKDYLSDQPNRNKTEMNIIEIHQN